MNLKAIPYQSKLVFDAIAEINETGDLVTYHGIPYRTHKSNLRDIITDKWVCTPNTLKACRKIICQEVGLDLEGIPYVELEEDVDMLAEMAWSNSPNIKTGNYEFDNMDWKLHFLVFKQGFKAAQPKQYTEKQMRFAISHAYLAGLRQANPLAIPTGMENEIIQSLKPRIESIDVDMIPTQMVDVRNDIRIEPDLHPLTYQEDGKTFVKLLKINYDHNILCV